MPAGATLSAAPAGWRSGRFSDAMTWIEGYRRFWEGSLDHLDYYLKTLTTEDRRMTTAREHDHCRGRSELLIERVFDAPRALVYAAWTQKKHLAQWSCPQDMTLSAVEFDGDAVTPGAPTGLCMTADDDVIFGSAVSTARSCQTSA